MIETVLSRPELMDEPPVLIDVGASGDVFASWARIAPFAHCLAFDPDLRDVDTIKSKASTFRSLRVLPRIVADRSTPAHPFYLARSPHCSSCLPPDLDSLENYSFSSVFQTLRETTLPAITLGEALGEVGFKRIDWLKIDAQGLDLRVFSQIPEPMVNHMVVIDFEPGIMGAYQGEDRLHHVMAHMEGRPYWCSACDVKGDFRVNAEILESVFSSRELRLLRATQRRAPGWAQLQYFASFGLLDQRPLRDHLLGWVCSTLLGHHLFALQLGVAIGQKFDDALAPLLVSSSRRTIRRGFLRALGSRAARVCAMLPIFRSST